MAAVLRLPHRPRRPARRSRTDLLLFRPDISRVGADSASVMRCRRSLLSAVGCCCCCHRCCQSPAASFVVWDGRATVGHCSGVEPAAMSPARGCWLAAARARGGGLDAWLTLVVPVAAPGGGYSYRTRLSCGISRPEGRMWARWNVRSLPAGTWQWTWPISRPPIKSRRRCAGSGSAAVRCTSGCWAPGTAPR